MASITDATLGKYEQLQAEEKLLVRLIEANRSDEAVASQMGITVKGVREMIVHIARELGIPATANLYGLRQQLQEVERQYKLKLEVQLHGAPRASLPDADIASVASAEEVEDADASSESPPADEGASALKADSPPEEPSAEVELPAARQRPAPPIDELVHKISGLKPKLRETLEGLYSYPNWGGLSKLAAHLKLSKAGVSIRLSSLYVAMGVEHLSSTERRALLRQAWQHHMRLWQDGDHPSLKREQTPAKILPSAAEEKEEGPLVGALATVPPHIPAEHGGGQAWGPGITLNLPSDVRAVDVVSGVFNGKSPSADVEAAVRKRKAQGLKPYALALYPSQHDPSVVLGHLVMIKQ